MAFLPVALLVAAMMLSTEQRVSNRPTVLDVESALTHDRYDDSCQSPTFDDCPMINIARVVVRDLRCRDARPAERAAVRGRYERAVMCSFRSAVTTAGRPASGPWRDERAMLFLVTPAWCRSGQKAGICGPRWFTTPAWE